MSWTWLILAAVIVGGLALIVGLAWWRRRQSEHVSTGWLDEREWYESQQGIDQACVQSWPIRKITNEAAHFNAAKLRRRA